MIIDDLTDARILVELRRRLSYAGAARALKLPAATISRRVMKMEERANILLFERSTRAVSITDAGQLAAQHAERILNEAEAVDHSIEGLRTKPVGVVRLSSPVIFGQAILGLVTAEFLQKYPDCRLDIELTDHQVDLIEDSIDVAIRVGPIVDESLRAKPLGTVYASLYRRATGKPAQVTIENLDCFALGLLHADSSPMAQLKLVSDNDIEHSIPVKPHLVCLNPWLLMEAALNQDLIVVLPNIVAEKNVEKGLLERVLPDTHVRRVPIQLVFPSRRLMRPALRRFIDLAAEVIPEMLKDQKNTDS